MFCEECQRIEDDDLFLDTETCSQCGGYLVASDEDSDEAEA